MQICLRWRSVFSFSRVLQLLPLKCICINLNSCVFINARKVAVWKLRCVWPTVRKDVGLIHSIQCSFTLYMLMTCISFLHEMPLLRYPNSNQQSCAGGKAVKTKTKNDEKQNTERRKRSKRNVCVLYYMKSEKGERERTRGYTLKSLDARKGPLDNHFRLFTSVVVRRTKRHWHFSTISYTLVRPDCMVFGFGKYPYLYLFYIYFYPIWNVSIDRKIYIPKLNWTRHR